MSLTSLLTKVSASILISTLGAQQIPKSNEPSVVVVPTEKLWLPPVVRDYELDASIGDQVYSLATASAGFTKLTLEKGKLVHSGDYFPYTNRPEFKTSLLDIVLNADRNNDKKITNEEFERESYRVFASRRFSAQEGKKIIEEFSKENKDLMRKVAINIARYKSDRKEAFEVFKETEDLLIGLFSGCRKVTLNENAKLCFGGFSPQNPINYPNAYILFSIRLGDLVNGSEKLNLADLKLLNEKVVSEYVNRRYQNQ